MTNKNKTVDFLIDHIDSLGQGVSKNNNEIIFIPKTLPGEAGRATIYKKSKGVSFAYTTLESITTKSPLRESPSCIHYKECQGCHFLHCNHKDELEFKKANLIRLFNKVSSNVSLKVITNNQRFHYRNRIQLHYDIRKRELGFINKYTKKIHSIPNCLLPHTEISQFLKNWYQDNSWLISAKNQKPKGHVELLYKENKVEIFWNQRYSSGGFTQVNKKINDEMLSLVSDFGIQSDPKIILDLFAGNGNLTNKIKNKTCSYREAVDLYPHGHDNKEFITLDLDDSNALNDFQTKSHLKKVDLLVVDPPRKGFKHLSDWCQKYIPQQIIYVSCNPQTLARDLLTLSDYNLCDLFLIDMFPGTYHYETMAVLKKK